MTKEEIRGRALQQRMALDSEQVALASQRIASLLFSRIAVHRYSVVHLFLPIRKNREPDTRLILEILQKDFPVEIYISKSLAEGEMLHAPYTADLRVSRWGIEEPADTAQALDSATFFQTFRNENVLVLIPLLAFDRTGHRIGYGKGYYDRFLMHAHAHTAKVGLSLLPPVEEIAECSSYDVRMDYCITPERVWHWE